MKRALFDVGKNPLPLGIPLLFTLAWHVADTVLFSNPQYLFFVCYAANALLCLGIILRSPLFVGSGFGWLLVAFPLWLYDAIRTSNWAPSCTAFHLTGLVAGAAAFRTCRWPRHTWAFSLGLGLGLQLLARLFTDESLNVNSAFRIYGGWERIYPNEAVYRLTMVLGFGLFFAALTRLNNRCLAREDGPGDA